MSPEMQREMAKEGKEHPWMSKMMLQRVARDHMRLSKKAKTAKKGAEEALEKGK